MQFNYTMANWRVSLSKICHEWANNAVTHECAQRMRELQRYLVMSVSRKCGVNHETCNNLRLQMHA